MRNPRILLIVWLLVHISVAESLGNTADVSVHVRSDKSTLVLGEPLFITAGIRNKAAELVKVYAQNSPSDKLRSKNPFMVMISADGKKYESWSDSLRRRYKTSPIELAAGAELVTDLVILFSGRHGFAFEQPGEYWISVKVIVHQVPYTGTSFQAEPIRITVTKPDRESSAAWNLLGSKEFGKTYGELVQVPWRAKLSGDDLEQCDHILETYPDSIYAEYLALSLGRWYQEGPKKDKTRSARYFEIARASATSDVIKSKATKALQPQ